MKNKQSLHIITMGKWFVLSFVILLLAGLSIWMFFGEISITMHCNGTITDAEPLKIIYYNSSSGRLEDISISEGQTVYYGQPVGHIVDSADGEIKSIYAPDTGEIVALNVSKNQQIDPSTAIAKIAKNHNSKSIFVMTLVSVSDISKIYEGMPVYVTHSEYSDSQITYGAVFEIMNSDFYGNTNISDWVVDEEAEEYINETGSLTIPVRIVMSADSEGNYYGINYEPVEGTFNYGELVDVEFVLSSKRPIDFLFSR